MLMNESHIKLRYCAMNSVKLDRDNIFIDSFLQPPVGIQIIFEPGTIRGGMSFSLRIFDDISCR